MLFYSYNDIHVNRLMLRGFLQNSDYRDDGWETLLLMVHEHILCSRRFLTVYFWTRNYSWKRNFYSNISTLNGVIANKIEDRNFRIDPRPRNFQFLVAESAQNRKFPDLNWLLWLNHTISFVIKAKTLLFSGKNWMCPDLVRNAFYALLRKCKINYFT